MDTLVLESSMVTSVTTVSNLFIDEYMPKANGDFVKVYLQLLRLLGVSAKFSLATLADTFNFTERDVVRALKYWEGLGLLSITRDDNGSIKGINLEPFGNNSHYIKGVQSMQIDSSEVNQELKNEPVLPPKKIYSADDIQAFHSDKQVGQLMFIAQAYLSKPLSSTDVNCLLYMYDSLALSIDFIEHIIVTCISDGHKSLSYMESAAISYYKRGITDSETAKQSKLSTSALSKKVLNAFGITGRVAGKEEIGFISKWQDEFGFNDELIVEACNRTISHTHNPSFKYANSILASWHKAGAKNISDVQSLDDKHTEETNKKYAEKKAAGVTTPKLKGGQMIANGDYDFSSLEKQLSNKF